jgi:uncharacterized protein involved in exopolysaccharide biosynthesis
MSAPDRDLTARGRRAYSLLNYDTDERLDTQRVQAQTAPSNAVTVEKIGDFLEVDLRRVKVWVRSGFRLAVALSIIGALLAASYGMLGTRRFTVSSEVLIEPSNIQVINNDLYAQPTQQQGEAQALVISNRARLMTSGNVLGRVVENLSLSRDEEFFKPPSPGILSPFVGTREVTPTDANLAAAKALRERISANVDPRSFVVELAVSAQTIEKAVSISEALITAFNAELADSEADSARRAAQSLDERLAALKSNALAAEEAVENYKRSKGLSTGDNGQLVSSQAMTQTNTQMLAARTRVIEAQANYNALIRASDSSAATVPAVSDTLRDLKLRAGALEQQLSAQRMTYGDRHPSIGRLQSELTAAREQIRTELQRTTNAAKAELDKANEALRGISSNMTELQNSAFDEGQAQVDLRELQRDALTKTQIYESFLSRVRQVTERERINTDTVRVVTPPVPPSSRSWPPGTAVLFIIGGMIGFMMGLGIAVVRGMTRDIRSTPDH